MKLIASVGVLLAGECSTFILQHRDNRPDIHYPGKIGLFGGEIEENEKPEEAAIREIKEELSIDIRNPILISTLSLEMMDELRFRRRYFYIVDISRELEQSCCLNEGQGIVKIGQKINICPDKFVPYDLAFILDYLLSLKSSKHNVIPPL